MRTLEEIRRANKRDNSLINTAVTPIDLTPEQYKLGRKEYESFVKPVSQRVFVRQLNKCNF